MKNFIFLLLFTLNSYSQSQGFNFKYEVLDPSTAGKIFRNPKRIADKPLGSPYSFKVFYPVKVENVAQNAIMRYNIYNDEFEFISPKNDTLILDKIIDFGNLEFVNLNIKYKLLKYLSSNEKNITGYLIVVHQNSKYTLYKKENIIFQEEKIAKTTLETNKPARYEKNKTIYYFNKNQNEVIEFPSNKRKLLKLFSVKKDVIENYIKSNSIDFEQEKDLIMTIDFLNTL